MNYEYIISNSKPIKIPESKKYSSNSIPNVPTPFSPSDRKEIIEKYMEDIYKKINFFKYK